MVPRWSLVVLLAGILSFIATGTNAAVGGGVSPTGERANAADLKYLACSTCQEVSKALYRRTAQLRKERGSYHFSEDDIFKLTENICNPQHKDGKWIKMHDVQEHSSGNHQLVLVPQKVEGHCGVECMTTSKSCKDLIDTHESELVELLWEKTTNRATVASKLCNSWTKRCNPKEVDALYDAFAADDDASAGAEPFLTEDQWRQQKKNKEAQDQAEQQGGARGVAAAAAGGIWTWLKGLYNQLPQMSRHGVQRWIRKQWKIAKSTDWETWWKEWLDIKKKESKELYALVKKQIRKDFKTLRSFVDSLMASPQGKSTRGRKNSRGGSGARDL